MATQLSAATKRQATPAERKKTTTPTVTLVASVVGAALGAALVRALPPTGAARLLGGAVIGAVIGLLPWFLGKRKGQGRLGKQSLIWSVVGGWRSACCSRAPWRSGLPPSFCAAANRSRGSRLTSAYSCQARRAPGFTQRGPPMADSGP